VPEPFPAPSLPPPFLRRPPALGSIRVSGFPFNCHFRFLGSFVFPAAEIGFFWPVSGVPNSVWLCDACRPLSAVRAFYSDLFFFRLRTGPGSRSFIPTACWFFFPSAQCFLDRILGLFLRGPQRTFVFRPRGLRFADMVSSLGLHAAVFPFFAAALFRFAVVCRSIWRSFRFQSPFSFPPRLGFFFFSPGGRLLFPDRVPVARQW